MVIMFSRAIRKRAICSLSVIAFYSNLFIVLWVKDSIGIKRAVCQDIFLELISDCFRV